MELGPVTGLILAGGQSSRFGSDKAFALWKGRPFLQLVHDAIKPVCQSVVVLIPATRELQRYARLAPGATILPDFRIEQGPVESLRGAAALIRHPTVLVVPCDAPGLTGELAKTLVTRAKKSSQAVVVSQKSSPLWDLFAAPKEFLVRKLVDAQTMEDLTRTATKVESKLEGLNVNEPPA